MLKHAILYRLLIHLKIHGSFLLFNNRLQNITWGLLYFVKRTPDTALFVAEWNIGRERSNRRTEKWTCSIHILICGENSLPRSVFPMEVFVLNGNKIETERSRYKQIFCTRSVCTDHVGVNL
jgi:hypothetical protein